MPNYILGWTSGGSVAENVPSGSVGFLNLDTASFPAAIGTIVVTGPGGAVYNVDPGSFEVTATGALDHETLPSVPLSILITFTDLSDNGGETLGLDVTNVNEAPILLPFNNVTTVSIGDTAVAGREVARVITTDPDPGDIVTLSLIGPDAGLFVLDGLRVRLANGVTLDHAAAPSLSFGVRATDGGALHADQVFTVHVESVIGQASSLQAVLGGGNGSAVGLTVTLSDEGPVLRLGGSAIVLSGQDTLATADGQLGFGAATGLAQVERLYLGLAGRAATGTERMMAADALEHGTVADLAASLLHGTEFTAYVQAHSAAPDVDGLSNAGFAELLYNRVLGRASDSPGLAFWTGALDQGLASRADTASLFAVSAEAQSIFGAQTRALWAVDAQAYQVRSLYDVALNREPDAGGLAFWRGVLETGVSMHTVADYIVGSAEFQSLVSGLTTDEIVEMFYQNGLERAADAGGKAFWAGVIDNGLGGWSDVLMQFAQGPEQDGQLASYRNGSDIFV